MCLTLKLTKLLSIFFFFALGNCKFDNTTIIFLANQLKDFNNNKACLPQFLQSHIW